MIGKHWGEKKAENKNLSVNTSVSGTFFVFPDVAF